MDSTNSEILLSNLERIHTTTLGIERIRRNLSLNVDDVIDWCKAQIQDPKSIIIRKGKNWYIDINNSIITVNAYSYTVITAHRNKKKREEK